MIESFKFTSSSKSQIAGRLTVHDWAQRRLVLSAGATQDDWVQAFDDFLQQRLSLRYLGPIAAILRNSTYEGEGFSIVALQCTLIEFLAATVVGKSYRFRRKTDPELGKFEYSDSRKIFCQFLVTQSPFKSDFDLATADDFYVSVRCGLLHEARTKNGWSVWAEDPAKIVDAGRRIVFRNNLDVGISEFLKDLRSRVATDQALQAAFVRKFDSLCQE